MDEFKTDLERAECLQNLLISIATRQGGDDRDYGELRDYFLQNPASKNIVPSWLRASRNPSQFMAFIMGKVGGYFERREFIRRELGPLRGLLEKGASPALAAITDQLADFSAGGGDNHWKKALERIPTDPEGAITRAKSFLEEVLKRILDERAVLYSGAADLPELYRLVAKELNLAPDQHTQDSFKKILGGIASIVNELGTLRNRLGDAHGRGKNMVRPAPRHAELAVSLAGSIARFLVETTKKQSAG